jgi:hypothetical protein
MLLTGNRLPVAGALQPYTEDDIKADFNFLGPERPASSGAIEHSGIYWSRGLEHATVGDGKLRLLNPKGGTLRCAISRWT